MNINYQLYNLTNTSQIQKHKVGLSFKFSNSKSFGIGATRYQTRRHQLLSIWNPNTQTKDLQRSVCITITYEYCPYLLNDLVNVPFYKIWFVRLWKHLETCCHTSCGLATLFFGSHAVLILFGLAVHQPKSQQCWPQSRMYVLFPTCKLKRFSSITKCLVIRYWYLLPGQLTGYAIIFLIQQSCTAWGCCMIYWWFYGVI